MGEYERGFKDGVTSKMNKELQPLLSEILTGISEAVKNTPKYLIDNMELKAIDRGRGQWENERYDDLLCCYIANCSECGYESTDKYKISESHRYCERCGADMTGGPDDESYN